VGVVTTTEAPVLVSAHYPQSHCRAERVTHENGAVDIEALERLRNIVPRRLQSATGPHDRIRSQPWCRCQPTGCWAGRERSCTGDPLALAG